MRKKLTAVCLSCSLALYSLPCVISADSTPSGSVKIEEGFKSVEFQQFVSENFDKDEDGYLSEEEINAVTKLEISYNPLIADISGYQIFKNLEVFDYDTWIYETEIKTFDFSIFPNIEKIHLEAQGVTSVSLDGCSNLEDLYISGTCINEIDLSDCAASLSELDLTLNEDLKSIKGLENCKRLYDISIYNSPISNLVLPQSEEMHSLEFVKCNCLTKIDISGVKKISILALREDRNLKYLILADDAWIDGVEVENVAIEAVDLTNKPDLTCFDGIFEGHKIMSHHTIVDDPEVPATYTETGLTAGSHCSGCGRIFEPQEVIPALVQPVELNSTNFSDADLLDYMTAFDTDEDGILSPEEIVEITKIDISGLDISSFDAIDSLVCLTYLDCADTHIKTLNLSRCKELSYLDISDTLIEDFASMGVSESLTVLRSSNSLLENVLLDGYDKLTSLDLTDSDSLVKINCSSPVLRSIKLDGCSKLEEIVCTNNKLTTFDLSGKPSLKRLDLSNDCLRSLDLSEVPELTYLNCSDNKISELDISVCPELTECDCSDNVIEFLHVGTLAKLQSLDCSVNNLVAIDASYDFACEELKTDTDVQVHRADFDHENVHYIDPIEPTASESGYTFGAYCEDCGAVLLEPTEILPVNGVKLDEVHFPDSLLLGKLSGEYDENNDGYLSVEEAAKVTSLYFGYMGKVTDLTGIKYLSNLKELDCERSELTSLDVSGMTSLEHINVGGSENLTKINVYECENLKELNCNSCNLHRLDVSDLDKLEYLICSDNSELSRLFYDGCDSLKVLSINGCNFAGKLEIIGYSNLEELSAACNNFTCFEVSDCPSLKYLEIYSNSIESIKGLDTCPVLESLNAYGNQLTQIDISNLNNLIYVYLEDNLITELDIENNPALEEILLNDNLLKELSISNCPKLTRLDAEDNVLEKVELSELPLLDEIDLYNNQLTELDLSGCPTLTEVNLAWNQSFNSILDLTANPLVNDFYSPASNVRTVVISEDSDLYTIYTTLEGNSDEYVDYETGTVYDCVNYWGQYDEDEDGYAIYGGIYMDADCVITTAYPTPEPEPTLTPSPEPSGEPSPSPTPTVEPTPTSSPEPSPEPSGEPSPTDEPSPTATPSPTVAPTTPVPTQAPELSVGGFVDRCYEVALGREADDAGFDYWVSLLNEGQACGSQVGYGFIFSNEYMNKETTDEQYITDLYTLYFGREADEAGYNYWLNILKDGATREEVFAGFANSQEFYNLCEKYGVVSGYYSVGVPNDMQGGVNCFVARLYKVCLNRLPDMAGQNGWVIKLMNGEVSGSTCAYGFVFSSEFMALGLNDTDYVCYMYRAFFGREADEEGLNYWVSQLAGETATREDVFAGFSESIEFANLCGVYGINA